MDKKAQGSGSDKVLGIGKLLASICSANAPLEQSYQISITNAQGSRSYNVQIIELCRVAAANKI